MRLRISGVAPAAVLAGVSSVEAHPPCEGKARVLKTESGDIEVVKAYVDGILGTDLAKIVVRSHGTTHAETEFYRDTSLDCSRRRCLIAAADSPIIAIRQGARIGQRESRAAGCFATLVAAGAVGILVWWLYVVVVLSELSMIWALLLGAALLIAVRAVRA